jgi:hypothetical protein
MVQNSKFPSAQEQPHSDISCPRTPHPVPCQALFLHISLQLTDLTQDTGSPKTPVFALIFAILKLGKDIAARSPLHFDSDSSSFFSPALTRFLSNFCREI